MTRTGSRQAYQAERAAAPDVLLADEARWVAFMQRDASCDGAFYVAVATTGIYCRPSCPARRPKRENVSFHATCGAAEAAGYRSCKRCRPDEPSLTQNHTVTAMAACRRIETAEGEPRLAELAAEAGLSPHHFHRVFKSVTGVTPKAYAAARRADRIRDKLGKDTTVTEAIYGAGYSSNGRFYAAAPGLLGMQPARFRKGAPDEEIRYVVDDCSLGWILVAAAGKGVCAILLGEDPDALVKDLASSFPKARLIAGDKSFARTVKTVIAFVEEPRSGLNLPLDIRGTAFQHRVWQALRNIPPGETASYADIAKAIGAPKAVRAVGTACGANPIAVAVPCHRVVGSNGALTGYRGGLARKRALLEREAKT